MAMFIFDETAHTKDLLSFCLQWRIVFFENPKIIWPKRSPTTTFWKHFLENDDVILFDICGISMLPCLLAFLEDLWHILSNFFFYFLVKLFKFFISEQSFIIRASFNTGL